MTRGIRSSFTVVGALTLATLFTSSVPSAEGLWLRDRMKPTAPTNLVVTGTTEHSVSLAWEPSTDDSGRFVYLICCPTGMNTTVSQTETSHTVEGLQSGKTYIIRVYARDSAGNTSSASNPVTVTLPGQIAAPTRPIVEVLDVGPTHVTLSWVSTDDGPLIWYTIFVDGQQVSTLNSRTKTFTCAAVLVPTGCVPLNQDTTYTFTVRARDANGNNSPMSEPAVVTTDPADPNDTTPPTPPANLTAVDDGGFIVVDWDASTDAVAPQALIRYDVYVNGELRAVVVGQTIAAEVDGDPGFNEIRVIAVDTADNESEASVTELIF
jgi:chitodextrinase